MFSIIAQLYDIGITFLFFSPQAARRRSKLFFFTNCFLKGIIFTAFYAAFQSNGGRTEQK